MPDDLDPNAPVFSGGSSRPNTRFRLLCDLAGVKPRLNIETGKEEPWQLKDLRKTCATYHDEHMPESSIEILGPRDDAKRNFLGGARPAFLQAETR